MGINFSDVKDPILDVAGLAAIELYTPNPDETVTFFRDLLGMIETERKNGSVYLRGWEDPYKHSLKITHRDQPGMASATWRVTSSKALDRRIKALEKLGLPGHWVSADCGMGRAWEFTTPDGAVQQLVWEVEYYEAPEEERSIVLNRHQRRPLRGIPIKSLDHINILSGDVAANRQMFDEGLGFRLSEQIVELDGSESGAWLRAQTRSHDVALVKDSAGNGGRLHHAAFLFGNLQHLDDACDVLTDNGIEFEAGPARHAVSQAQFIYVFEPGGNRIELVGVPGYQVFDPTFQPVVWKQDSLDNAIIWYGSPLPAEFDTYGTPAVVPTKYRTPNRYVLAEAAAIMDSTQ
ncbi:VOC family protein [Corynebacterium glutamicum]|uniref:VOC family protein n=1 Tax=Corynebacterium glutamicum TaxID=1718 RepID=UPI003C7E2509